MKPPLIPAAELELDPHTAFRQYRTSTPVIQRDDGVYLVLRADDVDRLATDPRTRQLETEAIVARGVTEGPLFDFINNTMLLSNGVAHRRRRSPFSRAFAQTVMNDLRPHVRATVNRLIDQHFTRGEMLFRDEFAAQVPAHVIANILGIPPDDIPEFTRNIYQLSRVFTSAFSKADVPDLQATSDVLTRYVERLFEERRRHPRNDLLTSYMQAVEEAEVLTRAETLSQIVTVILGGSDTTRGALTILMSLLLQNPDQWEAVIRDPSLVRCAVVESLRYEPSVGSFPRITLEDIDVDGSTVPRNCILSMSTVSAMRDPVRYDDPDRFNIHRTDLPRRLVIFGAGSHRCLGETLALIELEEALAAIAERLPTIELVGDAATVIGSSAIRPVSDMPVRWAL